MKLFCYFDLKLQQHSLLRNCFQIPNLPEIIEAKNSKALLSNFSADSEHPLLLFQSVFRFGYSEGSSRFHVKFRFENHDPERENILLTETDRMQIPQRYKNKFMKRNVKRMPVYYNPSFLSTADFWPERQDLGTDWYLPLAV